MDPFALIKGSIAMGQSVLEVGAIIEHIEEPGNRRAGCAKHGEVSYPQITDTTSEQRRAAPRLHS